MQSFHLWCFYDPTQPNLPWSIIAEGQNTMLEETNGLWVLLMGRAFYKNSRTLYQWTSLSGPHIFPIPAKLRKGTAGEVTRLGQGGQSGSVLGCGR